MASRSKEDLYCSICHDIYKDPVVLSCNHNFCRDCVENLWRTTETRECSVCLRRDSKELSPNMALRNTCEVFQRQSAVLESVCPLHNENLKLFCREHQQPVCLICRDSEQHMGHTIRPINEEAPTIREELENKLKLLKDKIQELSKSKEIFSETATHVKTQSNITENIILENFRKLHQFLEKEQQIRIQALREEEEQKINSLKDKIAEVGREIEALSATITVVEKQLGDSETSILLKYKASVKRMMSSSQVKTPVLGLGAPIDQAKHLGNLGFNIWNNMKNLVEFYPVILDPNTAHPSLKLSEDLTSVSFLEAQRTPEIPEQFSSYARVLGSEGFSAGSHSWEVEVSGKDYWSVGVVSESVERKGIMGTGNWEIYFINGKYKVVSKPEIFRLLDVNNLSRVRLNLDVDKETLSFFDGDTDMCLYKFTHCFGKKLFPCFVTYNTTPLKVLSSKRYLTMFSTAF